MLFRSIRGAMVTEGFKTGSVIDGEDEFRLIGGLGGDERSDEIRSSSSH